MENASGAGTVPTNPERLAGSVKYYQRHVFVCTGKTGWPAHIDEDGGFCQGLSEAIAAAGPRLAQAVKVNACDVPSLGQGTDLLVFPDRVRYLGLGPDDLGAFVDQCLVGEAGAAPLAHEPLTGRHIFVCVHQERDPRCGGCGPAIADRLGEALAARNLSGQVQVHRTSHVGGHQYAGNLLIYPEGDWYGLVTPEDVPGIVEQHLLAGRIVYSHWRGRMGLTQAQESELRTRWQTGATQAVPGPADR
ncbi:MAG TPA: sucrase/ferredoxin-like family protein [Anaerolineae bacterium]